MSQSDAQKRAKAKYAKEKLKQVQVIFSPQEAELYDFLCQQPNKSGFIKELIRKSMES